MAGGGGSKAPGGMLGERLGLWQTCHFTLVPPCVSDAFSGRARRKEKKEILEPGMTPVFGVGVVLLFAVYQVTQVQFSSLCVAD